MFTDAQNTFSRAQTVTGSAYSENIIDTGNRGLGDTDISLLINVKTSVAGGSVTFSLESSDSTDFATAKTENISRVYSAEELTAGRDSILLRISHITGRYLRVKYEPSATLTSGAFTARLVEGGQTNR